MATAKIMEVFKDPVFGSQDTHMELEEIDFWREVQNHVQSDKIYINMLFLYFFSYVSSWRVDKRAGCGDRKN